MGIAAPQLARSGDRLPIDVFIVSPNPRIRQALQEKLGPPRWNVTEARSGTGALELLYKGGADDSVLLLDPMLPDLEPNEFQGIVKDRFPNTQVLILNSHTGQLLLGTTSPTPVSTRLVDAVNRGGQVQAASPPALSVDDARQRAEGRNNLRGMIGDSDAMQRIYTLTRKGIDLAPVLTEMVLWASAHEKTGNQPLVEQMRKNKEQFIEQIRQRWAEKVKQLPVSPR